MSNTVERMRGVKDRVIALLTRFPHLQDNDDKLTATIWRQDIVAGGRMPDSLTGLEVLKLYAEGKLTNAESIRRSRAAIQAETPELRGKNYKGRQMEGEDTRQDIHDL